MEIEIKGFIINKVLCSVNVWLSFSLSCLNLPLIPTPEKISPTLLEIPPNSWLYEAFSLTRDARAFLIRGTQYPLSAMAWLWNFTGDGRNGGHSILLPPSLWCIGLRERKRERCWSGNVLAEEIQGRTSPVWWKSDSLSIDWAHSNIWRDRYCK